MTDRPFFEDVEPIGYAGPGSDDPFSFRWYDPDRVVAGRTMCEHLRMAVCWWHSFVRPGSDVFGDGTQSAPAGLSPRSPQHGS
jgi:xylose isomerase